MESNFENLLEMAKTGDAEALNRIGEMYFDGIGIEENKEKAFELYMKAAKMGLGKAMFNVGVYYDRGYVGREDKAEAFKWCMKAAEQGVALAQFYIGLFYDNGVGVEQNKKEALKWYLKAAEQGNEDAQINVVDLYCSNNGVEQNFDKCYKWLKRIPDDNEKKDLLKKKVEFEKLVKLFNDDDFQNKCVPSFFLGKFNQDKVDKNDWGTGEFGKTVTNPIPVNGTIGEVTYLSKLLLNNGMKVYFHRVGSRKYNGVYIDIFEVISSDCEVREYLYFDMYHYYKSSLVPNGYKSQGFCTTIRGWHTMCDNFPDNFYEWLTDNIMNVFHFPCFDMDAKFIDVAAYHKKYDN